MIHWKKVDGFSSYSVSDTGLVRNDNTGNLISICNSDTGYSVAHLCKNKKFYTVRVHRLVAQAFIPNSQNEKCVNHKNGIKTDNRVENLEWCSHSYNNIHSYTVLGRSSKNAIESMTKAKLKSVVCIETGKVYESITQAAKETGALRGNISRCLSGKRRTAGGFSWGYAV